MSELAHSVLPCARGCLFPPCGAVEETSAACVAARVGAMLGDRTRTSECGTTQTCIWYNSLATEGAKRHQKAWRWQRKTSQQAQHLCERP